MAIVVGEWGYTYFVPRSYKLSPFLLKGYISRVGYGRSKKY